MTANPNSAAQGSLPGWRSGPGAWAGRLRVLIALVVGTMASLMAIQSPASAGTTPACNYDRLDHVREEAEAVALAPDPLTDSAHQLRGCRYDDTAKVARTIARQVGDRVAPQATPDPACGDRVVIGESTQRTGSAAAAFGATIWSGPPFGASHVEICAANEAWINGVIQRGAHVIDIGIDASRQGSRSPYYALELRELAAANYPVDRRPWPASPEPYVDQNYGGPCP